MEIKSIFDCEFVPYGKGIPNLDTAGLLIALANLERPHDGVVYVPSCPELEATPAFAGLRDGVYGGMPIQIGYCNGTNTKLNCLEYHRDSEINITLDDIILLLAREQDMRDGLLDTAKVEAFRVPAGSAVELYATTLHYAPCDGVKDAGFRVAVVLPKGTNTERPEVLPGIPEDRLLWARNKWLIAHPHSAEAAQGAFRGLMGPSPDITDFNE